MFVWIHNTWRDLSAMVNFSHDEKIEYFSDYSRARRLIGFLVVVWVVIYGGSEAIRLHWDYLSPVLPWKCNVPVEVMEQRLRALEQLYCTQGEGSSCDAEKIATETTLIEQRVCSSEEDQLRYGPIYKRDSGPIGAALNVERLRSYLSQEQVSRLQLTLDKEIQSRLPALLDSRERVINQLSRIAQNFGSHLSPPSALLLSDATGPAAKAAVLKNANMKNLASFAISVEEYYIKKTEQSCQFFNTPVGRINVLEYQKKQNQEPFKYPLLSETHRRVDGCSERGRQLEAAVNAAQQQLKDEIGTFQDIKAVLPLLTPPLSFLIRQAMESQPPFGRIFAESKGVLSRVTA